MKRILLLLMLISAVCFGQQRSHYSQYVQNMSVLNPATTGMYKGMDLRLGIRNQWQGLENAPRTSYVSFSSPLFLGGDMSNYSSADLGVIDPATKDDKYSYEGSLSHHGLGVLLVNDKTGPINRLTANITYAYHISLSGVANLAVGVGAGVNRVGLNTENLVFEESDDPVIASSNVINKMTPDINAGLYLYGADYYVGASMQQILPNKLAFNGSANSGKEVAHYFITGGYKIWVAEDFCVTPSVMIKYVRPLPAAYDLNLKVAYRNNFWIGGSYRKRDAISGMLGFAIAQIATIGYAYDYTTSEVKNISSGTHELTLGVRF